jgi:hypothetical protein
MSTKSDWWQDILNGYKAEGRTDAEKGIFDPPHYVTDDDPQYLDENEAYKDGFMEKRKELGDKFKWA